MCGPLTVHDPFPDLDQFYIGTPHTYTFQDDYGDSYYEALTTEAMTWEEGTKYC